MDIFDHPTKKDRAWLLPDAQNHQIRPGLYLVPTPIGHLSDMTIRALDVLNKADVIVCEDTRVTGKLLSYYGLKKTLLPYNDHNAARQRDKILEYLNSDQVVAQVSDAGMPMISDPGFKLMEMAREKDIYVTALPGANAPLTALLLSGFPSDHFCFTGFLPTKTGARKKALALWENVPGTLIIFESAKRLSKTLTDIQSVMGDVPVAVVREMSKLYEEVKKDAVQNLVSFYKNEGMPKGEITIVIGPRAKENKALEDYSNEVRDLLKTHSTKDVVSEIASRSSHAKKDVYDFVLKIAKQ